MTKNIELNHQLLINLDEKVYVSGQISVDKMEGLKKNEFKLIVNNRPDDEEIKQPKSIDLQELSKGFEIEYKYIPFSGSNVSSHQIMELSNLLKKNSKTLLFCRSGARSSLIWGLASVLYLNKDIDDTMRKISNVGYDSTIIPNMVEYFSNS